MLGFRSLLVYRRRLGGALAATSGAVLAATTASTAGLLRHPLQRSLVLTLLALEIVGQRVVGLGVHIRILPLLAREGRHGVRVLGAARIRHLSFTRKNTYAFGLMKWTLRNDWRFRYVTSSLSVTRSSLASAELGRMRRLNDGSKQLCCLT